MSSNTRIEINYAGVGELLKSAEMAALMEQFGVQIAARAGSDYAVRVHNSGQRQIANVYPASEEAARDNYENKTLIRALGG